MHRAMINSHSWCKGSFVLSPKQEKEVLGSSPFPPSLPNLTVYANNEMKLGFKSQKL